MYFPTPKIRRKKRQGGGNTRRPFLWGRNHTADSDTDSSEILDSDSDVDLDIEQFDSEPNPMATENLAGDVDEDAFNPVQPQSDTGN